MSLKRAYNDLGCIFASLTRCGYHITSLAREREVGVVLHLPHSPGQLPRHEHHPSFESGANKGWLPSHCYSTLIAAPPPSFAPNTKGGVLPWCSKCILSTIVNGFFSLLFAVTNQPTSRRTGSGENSKYSTLTSHLPPPSTPYVSVSRIFITSFESLSYFRGCSRPETPHELEQMGSNPPFAHDFTKRCSATVHDYRYGRRTKADAVETRRIWAQSWTRREGLTSQ
ncbi:hypothetical protein BC826DRAFT_38628 [Russula brevipes]|nr:hypothetical protein BC826DRAFT_38628 [Russula brevipes]